MSAIHEKKWRIWHFRPPQRKTPRTAKQQQNGPDMRATSSSISLLSALMNFATVCSLPVRGYSSLGSTCYKVFKRRIPPQNVSAPAPPPLPSRFETRTLQQGPSTQISLTPHCFLLLTSPTSLPQQHARIPCVSPTPGAHRQRVRGHRIRFPFASTCVVFTRSEGVYTYSSGCDSSVIFHLVSPRVIIISLRGYASFGLHVVSVLHLASSFFKVQRNEFSPKSVSALLIFVPSSPRAALYPSTGAMHLVKKPVILPPCISPMAMSMVFRLAVAEVCALVSVRSPISHYSMLDWCSQQQASAADTGGGGELEGEGGCGSNDVTLERQQPVLDGGISGVGLCQRPAT